MITSEQLARQRLCAMRQLWSDGEPDGALRAFAFTLLMFFGLNFCGRSRWLLRWRVRPETSVAKEEVDEPNGHRDQQRHADDVVKCIPEQMPVSHVPSVLRASR
jgi:hypothetical protein